MELDYKILDMNGKQLQLGHIVAVRYCWNSYIGEVTMRGLCATGSLRNAFFAPHVIDHKNTYQILSHKKESHPDYNSAVNQWYNSEDEDSQCPVKIRIYETQDWLDTVKEAEAAINKVTL